MGDKHVEGSAWHGSHPGVVREKSKDVEGSEKWINTGVEEEVMAPWGARRDEEGTRRVYRTAPEAGHTCGSFHDALVCITREAAAGFYDETRAISVHIMASERADPSSLETPFLVKAIAKCTIYNLY